MLFALQIICNCIRSEDESTLHQRSRSFSLFQFPTGQADTVRTLLWCDFDNFLEQMRSFKHPQLVGCATGHPLNNYPLCTAATSLHYTKYLKALWCGPHSECVVKITVESLCVCVAGYFENISRVEWFSLGRTNPAAVDQTKGGLDRGTHGGVEGRNTSNMLFWINNPGLLGWVRWLSCGKTSRCHLHKKADDLSLVRSEQVI